MVVVDISGTQVASLITPTEPPTLIKWDICPSAAFETLSDEEQMRWHPYIKECEAALETACDHQSDPLTAMTEGLLKVAAKHLGTKQYHVKSRVPWWHPGLAKLHRSLRRLHKRRQLLNVPTSKRTRYESQYQSTLTRYKHACRLARQKCLNDYAARYQPRDMNRIWRTTDRERGKRHPRYSRRVALDPDDAVEFWSGLFMESRFNRPDPPNPQSDRECGESLVSSIKDMREAMAAMNDTSPGMDGFRARLLKFIRGGNCAEHIMKGINRSCQLTISTKAKSSVTVLIRKPKTSGSQPSNYRPIALQPVMTKLVSKCVEHKLWKLVDDGTLDLSNSQAGFRPARSRYDQIFLLRCAQDHYHPWRRHGTPTPAARRLYAVFLDITKAYDSVPHVKLVERLSNAGVPD